MYKYANVPASHVTYDSSPLPPFSTLLPSNKIEACETECSLHLLFVSDYLFILIWRK